MYLCRPPPPAGNVEKTSLRPREDSAWGAIKDAPRRGVRGHVFRRDIDKTKKKIAGEDERSETTKKPKKRGRGGPTLGRGAKNGLRVKKDDDAMRMPLDRAENPADEEEKSAQFEDTGMSGLAGLTANDMTEGGARQTEDVRRAEARPLGLVLRPAVPGEPDIVTPLLSEAPHPTGLINRHRGNRPPEPEGGGGVRSGDKRKPLTTKIDLEEGGEDQREEDFIKGTDGKKARDEIEGITSEHVQ